jgi:hypothetical protein
MICPPVQQNGDCVHGRNTSKPKTRTVQTSYPLNCTGKNVGMEMQQAQPLPAAYEHKPVQDQFGRVQGPELGQTTMDDRSAANKAASNVNKTVGKVSDRTKVIYVKATGDGVQKVCYTSISKHATTKAF